MAPGGHVLTSENRKDRPKAAVLSIMAMFGASMWLLGDSPSPDTVFTLLCTVSSFGGRLGALKNRALPAALAWILGSMFLSFIVMDDMTSSVTVPDDSRISALSYCGIQSKIVHSGETYSALPETILWYRLRSNPGSLPAVNTIICGPRSEIDKMRRIFDLQSSYRIRVKHAEHSLLVGPVGPGGRTEFACPQKSFATKCRMVPSFVDNTEYNEYVSIVLRYGLSQSISQRLEASRWKVLMTDVSKALGSIEKEREWNHRVSQRLSKSRQTRYAAESTRDEFPTIFVRHAFGLALFSIVIEFLTRYISRAFSKRC